MEFFLILLVFGISYAISASIGHFYIYNDDRDSGASVTLGFDEMQKLKIYESAALHSREVVFAINQKLQVVTRIGVVDEEDVAAFRSAYMDENAQNLSLLQNLFTAESADQYVSKLPSRLFFLGRRWNIKNVYDNINSVLYVFLIDEDEFKYMISDITDLASIVECTRTSVVDRIDEYVLKVRKDNTARAVHFDEYRENLIRKLKLLVMHIAEMELEETIENISGLIGEMKAYRKNNIADFNEYFSEERFLELTNADRERILMTYEEQPKSYVNLIHQGQSLSEIDAYFEHMKEETSGILFQIKKDCFQHIIDSYVGNLIELGDIINRKINEVDIEYQVNNEELQRVFAVISDILPMIESELLDESMSLSERLRAGKSEYANFKIVLRGAGHAVKISFISDSESLSDIDIREISQGKFFRSANVVSGEVIQDEGKIVPHLHKCLKSVEMLGGKVEFKVDAGVSTEFIFTIPMV